MNLSLFDDLAAPVPDRPEPAQPLRSVRGRGRAVGRVAANVQGGGTDSSPHGGHGGAAAIVASTPSLFEEPASPAVQQTSSHGVPGLLPDAAVSRQSAETARRSAEISEQCAAHDQQQQAASARQRAEPSATFPLQSEPGLDEAGLPAPVRPAVLATPEVLHPALWRADQLGSGRQISTPSGFAALDAELPGGGWPHRVLTELMLPHPGLGELRLLAPALAAISHAEQAHVAGGPGIAAQALGGRCVMLFDPPAQLYASALAQLGVDARQWLVVRGRTPHGRPVGAAPRQGLLRQLLPQADVLWALEQALKSGHVGAVLAWLPAPLKADALRRLQLAAQSHDGPAFIFRETDACQRPSAAPLRLVLQSGGADSVLLKVLKRRGPPLARALQLLLPPVLSPEPEERAQGSLAANAQVKARRAALARGRSPVAGAAPLAADLALAAHLSGWAR